MNNLKEYIIEKFKINKDTKFINYEKVIKTIKEILNYIFSTKCANSLYKNDKLDDKFFEFNTDNNLIYMKCTNIFFKKYKKSDSYNIFSLLAEYKKDFGFENLVMLRRESDGMFIFKNWKFKDE